MIAPNPPIRDLWRLSPGRPDVDTQVMDERRGPDSGQVTHVRCPTCSAPVLLDPVRMELRATHAILRCTECGGEVPVRTTDIDRLAPQGIWAIASYAEASGREPPEKPKRKGIARLFQRSASSS
jgi:hypothetical protein